MAEESRAEEALTQANQYADEQAVYEVGFHVAPTVSEEEAAKVVAKIHAALKKMEAVVISEGALQKMTLAYAIERPGSGGKREKHSSASFGWIKFEAAPAGIHALQDMLRATGEILRFLLIETVREDASATPRRAVYASDRLEGKTIEKRPAVAPAKVGEVSEEELNKSLDALVS